MTSNTHVQTSSRYEILREVVQDYPGLVGAVEPLLRELNNSPQNWGLIMKEMRTYALKNFYVHDHHEKGIEAIKAIADIFLDAVRNPDKSIQQAAVENLIFYLEKILIDGNNDFQKYEQIFQDCFTSLNQLQKSQFFLLVTNPHQLKKLGQIILGKMPSGFNTKVFNDLLFRYFSTTFEYWLGQEEPLHWLKQWTHVILNGEKQKELESLFYPVSHTHLKELFSNLNGLIKSDEQYTRLKELLQLPGFMQLVKYYEDLAGMLAITGDVQKDLNIKLMYLLKIMETGSLSSIHENTLREINRTISHIVKIEEPEQIKSSLSDIFIVLKNSFKKYPDTALSCVQIIGNEIYNKGISNLVEWYLQKIISLGFQYPDIQGVTDEWQVKSNRAHLKNIRVWLELIENDPKWSKSLISALIINL